MAATTVELIEQGTATDVLTTELNSLASASSTAAGTAFNNAQATANFNGYPYASVQFTMASYTGTPAAGSALYVWFLKSIDGGTTYEDTAGARAPDVIIPIAQTGSGPQKVTVQNVPIPVGYFKAQAKNVNTGVTLNGSGNKVTLLPNTMQGV